MVATGLFHGLFLLPIILRSFAFGVGDSHDAKELPMGGEGEEHDGGNAKMRLAMNVIGQSERNGDGMALERISGKFKFFIFFCI